MPCVAFYTRISTDEDHQKFSLAAQEERLRAYCTAQYGNAWSLFQLYRDMESGSHTRRPGFEQMLADARAGAVDVIVVTKVDRLSRKLLDVLRLSDELRTLGVRLVSITESFDTTSPAGKMMLNMLGSFAEYERDMIIDRTKVGMAKKASGGRWVGGSVPYGYRLEDGRGLVPEPDEAAIVYRIFRDYIEKQEGVFTLCRKLNAAGLRKRSGQPWDRRVLLHMLRNPVYLGKIRWGGKVIDGTHEAVIANDLFERAGAILADRSDGMKGRAWHTHEERFLTGVIRCEMCGSPMVGVSGYKSGVRFPYYACTRRLGPKDCNQAYVRADFLEQVVLDDSKTILADDALLQPVTEEVDRIRNEQRPQLEAELRSLDGQRAKALDRRDRYFAAFEAGTLKPETCNSKVAELNEQISQLDAERERVATAIQRLELVAVSREELRSFILELDAVFSAGTNAQKKHLLHRVVKEVRVHDRSTVEVIYAVPSPDAVRTQPRLAPLERQRTNRMRELEPLVALRIVLRLHPRRATFRRHRVELELSESALPSPHERVAAKDRHLRHQRHLVLWEGLPAPPYRHSERHRTEIDRHRRAMVWKALLEAGVISNRAALARWQCVSRARVTQVLRSIAVRRRCKVLEPDQRVTG